MFTFALFVSIDPSLGRVDYSLMSDQTLMEMLIEGFDDESKQRYKDKDGMYLDVCKWKFTNCDDHQRVIDMFINNENVTGSLDLCYVPPRMKRLRISNMCGSSKLTGSVDLKQLPDGMKYLALENSQLTSEIDLAHLPDGMTYLSLSNNQITGEIDLSHLPHKMGCIYLDSNQLTGEIDLAHLPDGMKELSLENNQFSGSLVIKSLPQGMRTIDVRGNHFNAIALVDSRTYVTINLKGSGVTSVVDGNGEELDENKFLK